MEREEAVEHGYNPEQQKPCRYCGEPPEILEQEPDVEVHHECNREEFTGPGHVWYKEQHRETIEDILDDVKVIDSEFPDLSGWNYRVLHQRVNGEDLYGVHEVYYDLEDKPIMCSSSPQGPYGETLHEAKRDAALMLRAFQKPVLEYAEIGEPDKTAGQAHKG
jgi:hypothetical protein